ncbi:SPOCS domain-containing protein [Clostridium sp.]|uniref:SPOCS domain-containing protein n=1 Tax=Clostridium sp. TaxID=1506 RepID=UPI003D6D9C9D
MYKEKVRSNPYTKMVPTPNTPASVNALPIPVIGKFGQKEELVVKQITLAPLSPPIFRIVAIDKVVTVTNFKLASITAPGICHPWWTAKVIIDGYIDKNILYKTITDFTEEAVSGPVHQYTTRIEFATFVEVKSIDQIFLTDHVEICESIVEGDLDELLDPNDVAPGAPAFAITYNSLLEKMIVKIVVKITRNDYNNCCAR